MAYNETTNLSLQKPIDQNDINSDIDILQASNNANADILETTLGGETAIATNPSIVNTAGARIVNLYSCSAGSIATITGMLTNVPFTLINRSSGASLALLDASPKLLAGNWAGSSVGDNLTLIWNGTNYIEIARADV